MAHPIARIDAATTRLREKVGDRDATTCAAGLADDDLLSAGRDLAATLPPRPLPESVPDAAPPPAPWFQPLVDALSSGVLSRSQYDAIRRGLGEPPCVFTTRSGGSGAWAPSTGSTLRRGRTGDRQLRRGN